MIPGLTAALVFALLAFAQAGVSEPKGSIEGLVLNQISREPVPKAVVTLGGREPVVRAVTAADGRFVFHALPAGIYYLMVERSRFISPDEGWPPVKLGANEEKTGVEMALVPGASISGVVRNEYRKPVQGCPVNLWQMEWQRGAMRPAMQGGATTNDKGEYRVEQLQAGRYYLTVQCGQQLALPHPFMDRDDPLIPYALYVPQVYPGGRDFTAGGKITVAAGAELRGVDFDIQRTPAPAVYGHVTASGGAAGRDITVMLFPADPSLQGWIQYFGGAQRDKGRFQIPAVLPGSYALIAATSGEGPVCETRMNLQVGAGPPQPVEVALGSTELKGSVEIQGESAPPFENVHVNLEPLDLPAWWQHPSAQVGKDGRFAFGCVWPGRFRLELAGPVWVKSLRIGGEEVSPDGFTLRSGTGEMSVVAGTTQGSVAGAVAGVPPESNVAVVVLPDDEAKLAPGALRTQGLGTNRSFQLSLPPGRYRVFAVESLDWRFMSQMLALKTIAEKHGQPFEIGESERVTVAPEVVTAEELKGVLQEAR